MKFFSVMYQTSNSKGQELVAQRMVKWARRLGYDAWLITSIYHDGEPVVPLTEVLKSIDGYIMFEDDPKVGLPVIRVDSSKTFWPPRRITFRDFITILKNIDDKVGIDFIVTHSTLWNGPEEVSRWIMWKKLMRSLGESVNTTVYGHMSHYQPPDPTRYEPIERAYRMAWNSTTFPMIFRVADLVICVTNVEAEDMITHGARPDQIHLFPGGLDDDLATLIDNAKPDEFLERYRISRDKLVISYLGTVEERKNPLAVVRIAKRLKNLKDVVFVIAGKPGDQWDDVVREAKDLKNVVITGELSEEYKASLIKASYLNIIMSKMEALGLTQIEFMYGGVPVISSGTYGQKWLITNNVDGVIVRGPDDVEGAARAIEELVKNPSKRDLMSTNAREKAKKFLMSKLMEELLSKAKSILK
ncbi:MAG: glycosyltransferase family 4 protein [Desulfurococcaceae archaeon]|nr:glycosyltransferase family 4 protein [Desulfurococcaceae archaeon]